MNLREYDFFYVFLLIFFLFLVFSLFLPRCLYFPNTSFIPLFFVVRRLLLVLLFICCVSSPFPCVFERISYKASTAVSLDVVVLIHDSQRLVTLLKREAARPLIAFMFTFLVSLCILLPSVTHGVHTSLHSTLLVRKK